MRALGYRVPLALVNKAINASHLYPYCISLRASLRTYDQTLTKLKNRDNLVPLIAKYHLELQTFLANQGFPLQWNSYKLEKLVQELSDLVSVRQAWQTAFINCIVTSQDTLLSYLTPVLLHFSFRDFLTLAGVQLPGQSQLHDSRGRAH